MASTVLPPTKPEDHRLLPDRLELSHAVAFNFLDQLTSIVPALEEEDLLSVNIDLQPDDHEKLVGLAGSELWDWLLDHGHERPLRELSKKKLTVALVADLSHFMFESLVSAAKGKTAVAYALLRKPLKENLALLEWLLCDPASFLDRFHGDVPSALAWRSLTADQRREFISQSLSVINSPILEASFIYDVRYSKSCDYGLERLWQKATHLVTTVRGLETEASNLNFVFSTSADIEEQLDYYYLIVPPMMLYSLLVSEALIGGFVALDEDQQAFRGLLRTIALSRHVDSMEDGDSTRRSSRGFMELLDPLWDATCTECKCAISLDNDNVDRLWSAAEVACPQCGTVGDVWEAVFPGGSQK